MGTHGPGPDGAVVELTVGSGPAAEALNSLVADIAALPGATRAVLLRLPSTTSGDDRPADAAEVTAWQQALAAVEDLPLPTVALLGQRCAGVGFDLALCCDVRVAPDTVVVSAAAPTAGALPVGGTVTRLVRAAGQGVARDLLITGRPVAASEALAWGLVTRLTDGPADDEARALAATLGALSPQSLAATKLLALGASTDTLAQGLAAELSLWRTVREGANAQEGLSAFAEKRAPRFAGPGAG